MQQSTAMPRLDSDKPETIIHKGLDGVIVDETAISQVRPETNSLTYRGYAVQDLSAHCRFEEVAYLLWNGELPTKKQLVGLRARRAEAARDRANRMSRSSSAFPRRRIRWIRSAPRSASSARPRSRGAASPRPRTAAGP